MVTYDGSRRAAGAKIYVDGKPQSVIVEADALKDTMRTRVPLKIAQRNKASRINGVALQDLRIYSRALSDLEIEQLGSSARLAAILDKPADKRTKREATDLFNYWLGRDEKSDKAKSYRELAVQLAAVEREQAVVRERGTIAHVMQENPGPAKAFVLYRGEYDKRREEVSAATPTFLPPMPADYPHNRLGFARWLLRPENPLTAGGHEPLLARSLWRRTCEDFGGFRRQRRGPRQPGAFGLAGRRFP